VEALIWGLIYVLVAAGLIAVVCYIITRAGSQFFAGFAPFAWIVWAIGGLILILIMLRVFAPALGHAL